MIHARRRESGISRSRDRRSDRLYRVSSGGLLVHFLVPPFLPSLSLSLFLERYSSAFFTLGRRRRTENYRRYLDRTRYRALCLLKENRVVRINLCVYVCMYMYNGIIEEVVQCTLFSKIKPLGLRYVECS